MRDIAGGSRAVAWLMLVAGPYNLITGVLLKLGDPLPELLVLGLTSVVLFLVGLLCLRRPDRLPRVFWLLVPFAATGVVTLLNVVTADADLGPQLFYLWPLLYAASFLSRLLVGLTVVQISAGHALTAFQFAEPGGLLLDWVSITVAMAMTAAVVVGLRERNENLLRELEHQATSDALTGVANRRAFDTELHRAVGGGRLALIVVDVDHFKTINDTWGHAAGDRALCAVADALRTAGSALCVARLGGDEFAVLLQTGPDEAVLFAERARTLAGAAEGLPGGPLGLSIGVAAAPDHADTAEDLQRVADDALYQAKADGRGRTARYGPPRHNVDDMPSSPVSSRSSH
ncbi:MAG TPA: GGDEF domain-containing protein [Actinoplanes sp.]|nr:GGDEF domain-containing protein [Actinoplanes sp.]